MPVRDKKRKLTRLWMKHHEDVSQEESILGLMRMMNPAQIKELNEILGEEGEENGKISTDEWVLGESKEYITGLISKSDHPSGTRLFPILDLSQIHRTYALSKINHGSDPNCELRVYNSSLYTYSIKEIKSGDELSIDYPSLPSIKLFDTRIPNSPKTGGRVPHRPGKDNPEDS